MTNVYIIIYIVCLTAHIGVVWLLPYIPTQDGPSHIYNLVILKDLLNGGREWGDYFTVHLRAVPNMGFHLIAYPLLSVFPPLIVEKIFISCYMVLMGVSVPLLLRTFNRPVLPLAYLVFPVLFNFTLLMGFYSYAITVPLFILAFALSWEIRNRSIYVKFICLNAAGFVLFYFHLIPFIFFLMSLVTIIMAEAAGYKRKIRELFMLAVLILPSLLNLFYYLGQGTGGFSPDSLYLFSISRLLELIVDLSFFSTVNVLPWQLVPASLFMFLIVVFGLVSLKDIRTKWSRSEDIPTSEKTLIYLAAALIAIYLFAPSYIGAGAYLNQRIPWVILLIMVPLLQMPDTVFFKRFGQVVIVSVVVIFFVFNSALLWNQNLEVKKFLSGLDAQMPRGAFVMTFKPEVSEKFRVDVLLHAASYYGIFKGCVDIGNYETAFSYFPVHYKKGLPAFPSQYQIFYNPTSIDWSLYPSIHYLLGWELENRNKEKLLKNFNLVEEEISFTLWRRNQPDI
ncbi:MAG: hypothetical protein M0R70_04185 [Nitrospirae bacterium]|nr:hypothetical protein [Nitrospirota bacterium]